MAKLTRYTNFEALKSDVKLSKIASIKGNKQLSELEAFLKQLMRELPVKKKTKITDGK